MTSELIAESVSLLVYTVVGAVLTVGGLAAEYASLQQFGAGEMTVAVWLAAFGCLLLYAGVYAVGYKTVLTELVPSNSG